MQNFYQCLFSTQLWFCRELSNESNGECPTDSNSSGKELFVSKVLSYLFLFIINKAKKLDFLKVKNK